MNIEAWIILLTFSGVNITAIIGGIIHLTSRLTKIETDLAWVIRNCSLHLENK
jgi:hypothetical protein